MRRTVLAGIRSSKVERVRGYTSGSRFRAGVRRLAVALAAVVALLAAVAAPGALAANPQHDRFHDVDAFADDNFCDTGQTIEIAVDVWVNEWSAPNQSVFARNNARGTLTFTNPLTGDIVIEHFANTSSDVLVSGDPDGIHVVDTTVKGLPELFKPPHGGVLTRDAGYIVLRQTFDGDEFISGEILINKGPHPEAESDFELFCEIMPEALGIEG
jgi:hypothetical protein